MASFPGPYGRPASSGVLPALVVVAGAALFAVFLGLVASAFPPSFVAKLSFLLAGMLLVVGAVFTLRWGRPRSREDTGRRLLYVWLFLIGAFPWYLPFKFGPLPGLNPVRVGFMLLLAVLALELFFSAAARARVAERFRRAPVTFVLLAGMVAWMVVCSTTSELVVASMVSTAKLWLHAAAMFLAVVVFVRGVPDMTNAARALVLGAIVASAAAIVESRIGANLFAAFFPSDADAMEGLQWILIDKSRLGAYRASGTAAHPLALAEYLAAVLPAALYLLLVDRRRLWRAVAALALAVMLPALYLTHTRTGLVAGAFASVTMVFGIAWSWIRNRDRRVGKAMTGWFALITGVVLAAAVVVGAQTLLEGRNRIEASSTNARVEMLDGTRRLVERSPIVGYGPGLAADVLNYRAPSGALTIDSYYMSVSIEAGLVGLALFAALASTVFARLLGRDLVDPDERWLWRVAIAGSIAAMLVMKIGLSLTHNFDLMLVLIAASVVLAGPRRRAAPRAAVRRMPRPFVPSSRP